MKNNFLYRYTSNNEGIWSIGKRLLPESLIEEANKARKWLTKPSLPEGDYSFYMTEKGLEMYKKTLLKVHQKYLSNIKCRTYSLEEITKGKEIVYQDNYQIVVKNQ